MNSKFVQILPLTAELAALDQVKKSFTNILMTCWLSGERSLPFELFVFSLYGIRFKLYFDNLWIDCVAEIQNFTVCFMGQFVASSL